MCTTELSAKNASGQTLSMGASKEFSCSQPRTAPCSDVSVFQKASMSHFLDTHHTADPISLLESIRR